MPLPLDSSSEVSSSWLPTVHTRSFPSQFSITQCALTIRQVLLDFNFDSQNKFCDSVDLKNAWDNMQIPDELVPFCVCCYNVIEMTWFAQTELMVSLYQAILTQRNSLLLYLNLIILITRRRQYRVWVVYSWYCFSFISGQIRWRSKEATHLGNECSSWSKVLLGDIEMPRAKTLLQTSKKADIPSDFQ